MLKHVQDINHRRQKLQSGFQQPSAPKWTPREPTRYKALGERLGINGDEIHIMLEHALKIQDPTCLKLFERFLFAAKLVSTEPLAQYNAQRKQEYDNHLLAVAKHERKLETLAHQNARIKGTNAEIIEQINRRWKKIIMYLASQVDGKSYKKLVLPVEDAIVLEALFECQLAEVHPKVKIDVEAALALSFNEICNACAYIESVFAAKFPGLRFDGEVDEDPDVEDITVWDPGIC